MNVENKYTRSAAQRLVRRIDEMPIHGGLKSVIAAVVFGWVPWMVIAAIISFTFEVDSTFSIFIAGTILMSYIIYRIKKHGQLF